MTTRRKTHAGDAKSIADVLSDLKDVLRKIAKHPDADEAERNEAKRMLQAARGTAEADDDNDDDNDARGVTYASPRAAALDEAFGLAKRSPTVKREGSAVTFSSMTPDQARAQLAKGRNEGSGAR